MRVNKAVLIARIAERGVKGTYREQAIPTCSFTREVDEVNHSGQVSTTWRPVETMGQYAEGAAQSLAPGDEVLVDATLKYRRQTNKKAGASTSKTVVSGWTVPKAMSALVSTTGNSHTEPSR